MLHFKVIFCICVDDKKHGQLHFVKYTFFKRRGEGSPEPENLEKKKIDLLLIGWDWEAY